MNRDRESRTRIGSDASFFGDSFSNLEIDDNVRILHNLGLGLAANISTALAFQHDREREDNIMIFLKCLELLVSVETLRHVASRCEFENVLSPPPPPPNPHLSSGNGVARLPGRNSGQKAQRGHKKKISGRILADFTKNRQKRGRRKYSKDVPYF